jgi:hypothetical protein
MIAAPVNLNAIPETNINRRTFIPLGEISDLTFVKDEFTPEELDVIKKTPFLASRIEAVADSGNIIGYRDSYKNDLAKLQARQVYNFAINNPTAFLRSEFPAYLGSGNPEAASKLVDELYKRGETTESIKVLYDESLPFAPEYSTTASERRAINMATQGSNDPLGISDYIKPFFTTVGAIAGGPVGAAVINSLVQLGQTGKIDPKETATAAAAAYIGEQLTLEFGYDLTGDFSKRIVTLLGNIEECLLVRACEADAFLKLAEANIVSGQEKEAREFIQQHKDGKLPILL